VDTGVRSTGAKDGDMTSTKLFERFFYHALNCSFIRLALPSRKPRPVVLKNQLKGTRFHCANYRERGRAANLIIALFPPENGVIRR
jgi:hypothetical protein